MISEIGSIRKYIYEHRDDGIRCPCCDQFCKVYTRSINSTMARFLIKLVREYKKKNDWIYIRTGGYLGGDYSKLKYWKLIENRPNDSDETKKSSGYWRPTDRGIHFAENKMRLPGKAKIYMNELVEYTGNTVSIVDALGKRFNYKELMGNGETRNQATQG